MGLFALKANENISVSGVEVDGLAVESARRNALNNGCGDGQFEMFVPPKGAVGSEEWDDTTGVITDVPLASPLPSEFEGTFEITVANILAGILIDLKEVLWRFTAEGGRLILSGVLLEQSEEVIREFAAAGFSDLALKRVESGVGKNEWCLIVGRK